MKNVLLIDSAAGYNELKASIENVSNHNVFVGSSIKKIILILYLKKIDVIVLDSGFNEIGGYKILDVIKRHSISKKIPLIMLLPDLSEKSIKMSYNCGADLCLGTPILIDDILLSINCLVHSKLKHIS